MLPFASVAVAVTDWPIWTAAAAGLVNVAVNDETPPARTAVSVPRYVAPSPWPLPSVSQAGLAKNSTL